MSILIKGMEMPKNCRTCPMLFDGHSYRWCNITGESLGIEETDNGRDEYCPLIELPPHGRLIDADKLKSRLVLDNDSNELQRICADILKWIDIQETVIEVEGETDA